MGPGDVNKWAWFLANRQSPAGRAFRRDRAERVLQLAEQITEDRSGRDEDRLDFLRLDLDRGTDSLAYRFWPRIRQQTNTRKNDFWLQDMWRYLIAMEPVSSVEMYVDVWREARFRSTFDLWTPVRELERLPDEKRHQVTDVLIRQVEDSVANIEKRPGRDTEQSIRQDALQVLRAHRTPWTDEDRARDTLKRLRSAQGGDRTKQFEAIPKWLAHERPQHPLITMLADAPEPELRMLVMNALGAHPTPRNRHLLQKLLVDPDDRVRAAAAEVAGDLTALAKTPPVRFVSNPGFEPGESVQTEQGIK
jgi:hypothetical protein